MTKILTAILVVVLLGAFMDKAHADTESDRIEQCAANGAKLYQYMQEQTLIARPIPHDEGDLIMLFTQDEIKVAVSSGIAKLDYWALLSAITASKLFAVPERCTVVVPMSYFNQEVV